MPSSEYTAVPSSGRLKLKGGSAVNDSRISKKKKKHKVKESESAQDTGLGKTTESVDASTSLSNALREEDQDIVNRSEEAGPAGGDGKAIRKDWGKTEAEKRWEEQRRRRLDDRLKREGIKSHKERVEELNRYLSSLTQANDMPKIGPG